MQLHVAGSCTVKQDSTARQGEAWQWTLAPQVQLSIKKCYPQKKYQEAHFDTDEFGSSEHFHWDPRQRKKALAEATQLNKDKPNTRDELLLYTFEACTAMMDCSACYEKSQPIQHWIFSDGSQQLLWSSSSWKGEKLHIPCQTEKLNGALRPTVEKGFC